MAYHVGGVDEGICFLSAAAYQCFSRTGKEAEGKIWKKEGKTDHYVSCHVPALVYGKFSGRLIPKVWDMPRTISMEPEKLV